MPVATTAWVLVRQRLRSQLRRLLNHDTGRWVLLAGSVGLICGVAGFLLQTGADELGHLLLSRLIGLPPAIASAHAGEDLTAQGHFSWWLLQLILSGGGALAGWLAQRFAIEAKGGGTSHAVQAYHQKRGLIALRVPLTKLVASIVTLGSGGSGGREGPITLVGAGFGSWFAQRLSLSVRDRRILLVAGIAGGIAAVFRAPVAAALFSSEVLYQSADLESESLMPAFIASIISYCSTGVLTTFYATLMDRPQPVTSTDFDPPQGMTFGAADWPQLVGYGLLALVIVMVARLFCEVTRRVGKQASGSGLPVWATAALGAGSAGVVALILYQCAVLFDPARAELSLSTLGSGYGALHWCLHGGLGEGPRWATVGLLLLVAFGKVLTSALTVSSGGSGGMFGPAIAIGGCIGGAVGIAIAGSVVAPPPQACLLLGMAGLLAATHRCPIAAMLMVAEISGSYLLLIPSMWVCCISFLLMGRRSILVGQADRIEDSPAHRGHLFTDLFSASRVGSLLERAPAWQAINGSQTVAACRAALFASGQAILPVTDDDDLLLGYIQADDLRSLDEEPILDALLLANDLAHGAALALRVDDSLSAAMRRITGQKADALPVVDEHHHLIGIVSHHMLLDYYRMESERLRLERIDEGYESSTVGSGTGTVRRTRTQLGEA